MPDDTDAAVESLVRDAARSLSPSKHAHAMLESRVATLERELVYLRRRVDLLAKLLADAE